MENEVQEPNNKQTILCMGIFLLIVFIGVGYIYLVRYDSSKKNEKIVFNQLDQLDKQKEEAQSKNLQTQGDTKMKQYKSAPEMILEEGKDYTAVLKTSAGDIAIDLFETKTPITVNNFVFLANDGFYNNVRFHRIIKGFMVQTGDPLGTGTGGPGYRFNDEPFTGSYDRGTVAMANAGSNTNGSQFFIMHANQALPLNYVIFGKVSDAAGLAVLDKIAETPVKANAMGEMSTPTKEVTIQSVEVVAQ